MEKLRKRILEEGCALDESVLKVDSFLNHQVDVPLMYEVGQEFKKYFEGKGITKIVTIESSGITPAAMTALLMNLPLVILKKRQSRNMTDEVYQIKVHSFTKAMDYMLTLSKAYIEKEDQVLIIDDFLANGEAATGAISLVEEAGAVVAGLGILIEKSFQAGRASLQEKGYDIYSLVRIRKMGKGYLEFWN